MLPLFGDRDVDVQCLRRPRGLSVTIPTVMYPGMFVFEHKLSLTNENGLHRSIRRLQNPLENQAVEPEGAVV